MRFWLVIFAAAGLLFLVSCQEPLPPAPKQPVTNRIDQAAWPKTVDEAVSRILSTMPGADKARMQTLSRSDLISSLQGWDTKIRNEFGLSKGNTNLLADCQALYTDDPVTVIIDAVWRRLWPKTVDEAVLRISATMTDADKAQIRSQPRSALILTHHGWGTRIRNEFGLWKGNTNLLADCRAEHPDDASMVIIEAVWRRLRQIDKLLSSDPGNPTIRFSVGATNIKMDGPKNHRTNAKTN